MEKNPLNVFDNKKQIKINLLKKQLLFTIINTIINLFFLLVLTIAIIVVLRSDFFKALNNDTPKILKTIQKYLNNDIPTQISKINDLENKILDLVAISDIVMHLAVDLAKTYAILGNQLVALNFNEKVINITQNINQIRTNTDNIVKKFDNNNDYSAIIIIISATIGVDILINQIK